MPATRRPPDAAGVVREVISRLESALGRQRWRRDGDGLEELVATILSQNTSNRNSGPAYDRLVATFSDWSAVADAPVSRVERAIRSAGLGRQKAARIQAILRAIRADRGELSLEFLGRLPADQARDYLLRFKGVGPKTAACVLLFSFNLPVLPVDTHIHRIAGRLGLIGPKVSPEAAHGALEGLVEPRQFYNFHILLIKHGRTVCKARRPRCHDCVLRTMCPAAKRFISQGLAAGSVR